MSKREKVLITILVIVFVFGCFGVGYLKWGWIKKTLGLTPTINSTAIVSNTNKNQNTNESSIKKVAQIVDPGVSWIEPVKLSDLGLFKVSNNYDCSFETVDYYKVATLDAGGEIILARSECGMGTDQFFRFRKNSAGTYYYLAKHSYENSAENISNFMPSEGTSFEVDNMTSYASISSPDSITDGSNQIYKKKWSENFFSAFPGATKVAESSYGFIYASLDESNSENPNEIKMRTLYLKHADGTVTNYEISVPFLSDDLVPNVTTTSGKNREKYFTSIIAAHCGSITQYSVIAEATLKSRLIEAGTTTDGDKIYYPKDANDLLYTIAYETYKVGRETDAMSIAEFAALKPLFLWKDAFGYYITFYNQKYGPLAECGKPVIYLYPETKTEVSVEVGANITKSDPPYGNGWNVVANPNGIIIYDGKSYDYLFWEGKGQEYPAIKSGIIVPRLGVELMITNQLLQLGLNQYEISDFLEFWLPKMPDSSFVRLTWFGTNEMNRMAPLNVNPKPDTTIRVFLDFEGLDSIKNIQAQKLTHIKRSGFTLVEWGGLLIGE